MIITVRMIFYRTSILSDKYESKMFSYELLWFRTILIGTEPETVTE